MPGGSTTIRLRYNSRIDAGRSRLTLTRPDGSTVVLPIGKAPKPDLLITQAALKPGAYSLRWQVLAIDGHITRGDVPFTVTAPCRPRPDVSLLVDLFGYLAVVIHGLTIVAQSMALGGVLFLIFLARPFAELPAGPGIVRDTARIAGLAALGLVACEALTLAMQGSVLVSTVDLTWANVLGASFAVASLVKIAAALVLAAALLGAGRRAPAWLLLLAGAVALAAATLTTHAAARMTGRAPLLAVEALHQLGAAVWIGGIPAFVLALGRVRDGAGWRAIGARFSRMSMLGVACIVVSGAAMGVVYVGSLAGTVRHRVRRDGLRQDRPVRRPARPGLRQFPGRRAAARRFRRLRAAAEAVR